MTTTTSATIPGAGPASPTHRRLTSFIAGSFVPFPGGGAHGERDDLIELIDPRSGSRSGAAASAGPATVDAAFTAARSAASEMARLTPAARQRALLDAARDVRDRARTFAELEALETGKSVETVLAEEIPHIIDVLEFFAGQARHLSGIASAEYAEGRHSWWRREPVGVVAQITPWNYPLMMAAWKLAPALAAGNACVIKPSETTPATTLLLAQALQEYLPAGAVNVVLGGRETGALLSAHPGAQMVAITGSTAAGRSVAAAAARNTIPVHLELGGNAAALIFDDADLDQAAAGVVAGAMVNSGQDCTAASRILVHRRVHDAFVTALASALDELQGPAGSTLGPLITHGHFQQTLTKLQQLPSHIEVVRGGERAGSSGWFIQPTLLTGARQDDLIVQAETFAPIVTVQSFDDEAHALELANGVSQGLAGSIWTHSHDRALRCSAALESGVVWINTHGDVLPEMPHGGFGASGYGKDLSALALNEFTRIKHVMSRSQGITS